jgi:fatty-acyl-CoA synthase
METPLTPLEFARRARRLYGDREGVVDGALRLSYADFFDRCDQWSAALQRMGIAKGDRVAYIAPNTHSQLESFYAVPQIGGVVVPINYRLNADELAYIIDHSGARIVCVHSDYLRVVEKIRAKLPAVKHFVALEWDDRGASGWTTRLQSPPNHPDSSPFRLRRVTSSRSTTRAARLQTPRA